MKEHFHSLNSYFDKIYVLSLPRLQERIEYMNRTFDGLNFEYFWGIDKQTTSLEELKEQGLYSSERFRSFYRTEDEISLGMMCCSIGHMQIYQDILENGYKRTLILEDDAIPLIENFHKFPFIMDELPSDWELLYLGYEKNEIYGWKARAKKILYKIFSPYNKLRLNKNIFSNYYPKPLTQYIARAGFHDCTHTYAITLDGAKKLLDMQTPVTFHADNLLSLLVCSGELNGYICRPKLFNQLTAFANKLPSLTAA